MDNVLRRARSLLFFVSVAALPGMGFAQPDLSSSDVPRGMGRERADVPRHGHGYKEYVTGRHWKDALTDEQKAEIDWVTLTLLQSQQPLGTQIAAKEAEINQLIIGEDVDQDLLSSKLDELLQLRREYLLNKYRRMIEMRQILTPQQRVSFDMDVLSRW